MIDDINMVIWKLKKKAETGGILKRITVPRTSRWAENLRRYITNKHHLLSLSKSVSVLTVKAVFYLQTDNHKNDNEQHNVYNNNAQRKKID